MNANSLSSAIRPFVSLRLCLVAALVMSWLVLGSMPARATISVLNYWRMGENQPGAEAGSAATNLTDVAGSYNLTVSGQAAFSADVAAAAVMSTRSTLSVVFTNSGFASNAIVSSLVNNFGIEAWVKPASVTSGQVIAYNGSSATSGWGLMVSASNYSGLFGGKVIFGSGAATPNVWTHVALVRDSGTCTLYVNGVASGTSGATPNTPTGNFALAAPPQSPTSQFLTGLVDEVRVFTFTGGQFSVNDLLINQVAPSFKLGTTSLLVGPAAGSNSVILAVTPLTQAWTAEANDSWLQLDTNNQSGSGSANVVFSFDENLGATRTGSLTVAGQTLTVTQAGSNYVATGAAATIVASGLYYPFGLTTDAAGDVYIADTDNDAIKEWFVANDTLTNLITGVTSPQSVALDAAGNIYTVDYQDAVIKEWLAASGTLTNLVSSGLDYPSALALDSAGNVYIADSGDNAIKEWVAANGTVIPVVASGLSNPGGVAVDIAGNVYIADTGNFAIKKWTAANGNVTTLVAAGLNYPNAVAVDGSGNVIIADSFNYAAKEWSAANQTVTTLVSGLFDPNGVAADGAGNVYVADTGNSRILEVPNAYLDPTPILERSAAGSDALPAVLPANADLHGAFTPASDQPWLSLNGAVNGIVNFSFTANTGPSRAAHITVLGQTIPVTQAAGTAPPPPSITSATLLPGNVLQLVFSGAPEASYGLQTSTDLENWSTLIQLNSDTNGAFDYEFSSTTNHPQLYFRLTFP